MTGFVRIRCVFPDGAVGTALCNKFGEPISPVFDSLVELYPWLRVNGWRVVPGNGSEYLKGD